MMRLPFAVLFAALVVVAAGSVVVTTLFKSDEYVIDVSGLAVGQNKTVELGFIPYKIKILSNVSAWYAVHIYADAVFAIPTEMGSFVVYNNLVMYVPSNTTVAVKVLDARDTRAKIVVTRTN